MTKHAVEAFSKSLRGELAPHGIDVTKINPGPYNTGFNDRMVDGITEYIDSGDTSQTSPKPKKRLQRRCCPKASAPCCGKSSRLRVTN